MNHLSFLSSEVIVDAAIEMGISGLETCWSWRIKDSCLNILML